MSDTIGFIGLGRLGLPVASNLINKGYSLLVYNRTSSKADPLVAQGARLVERPADAVTGGGVVVTLLWDDQSLEDVVTSEGFLAQLGPNGVHISMSTVAPETAKKMTELHAQHGSFYIDAPIFGVPEAAVAHELWIPFSGPQAAKERVRPLLTAMGAQGVFDFGEEAGAANIVKIVGNFLIISAGRSIQEALALAAKNDVDPKAVIDMLTQTLFSAPIYKSYGNRIAAGNISFSRNAIPLKDTGLFISIGQQVGSPTPISSLLNSLMKNPAE